MKITDYLAIYAAVLSTLIFVWNVVQSRPRVRVDLIFGVKTDEGVTQSGAYIMVRNLSSHEVHLSSIGFLYPYKRRQFMEQLRHLLRFRRVPRRIGWVHSSLSFFSISNGCPVSLPARKAHEVFLPMDVIKRMLAEASEPRLMASVQDQVWNNVYSKPFDCSFALRSDA